MIIHKKQVLSNLMLLFLSPPVFLIVYDAVFTFLPLMDGRAFLPPAVTAYMVTLDLCLLVSLIWFYKIVDSRRVGSVRLVSPNKPLTNFVSVVLVFLSVLFFLYLVQHVFNSYDPLNVLYKNQTFYTESRRGASWVYYLLNSLVFIALYDFYLNGFTRVKTICFFCLVIVNAAAGSRGNIITYFFCFIIIYGVTWEGRRILFAGILVVLFAFATFAYNTLSRSGSENVGEYVESSASTADFNQATAINDSIDYWDQKGGCYTCFFQDLSTFFIPRYLYPDKPMSNAETREVYPQVAQIGSTWTFGLYGSTIINMGLVAFLFIPVFYFTYSYIFFTSVTSRQKSFVRFSVIYFGANAIQFVRGGVVDVRLVRLLMTLAVVYILYVFLLHTINKLKFTIRPQKTLSSNVKNLQ